jgi:hypothetical protein
MPIRRAGFVSWVRSSPTTRPVAQNDDAVGDAENLVETMRNVDHADPARFQNAHRGEEPRDLIGRQTSGGFVQDEKVALDHERPRDRHKRFLRAAQRLDARVRLDVAADPAKVVSGCPVAFGPVDDSGPAKKRRASEPARKRDILGHGHPLDQAKVLMNESDVAVALTPSARITGAVETDRARIRFVYAAQNLDQRRFSGAVLSEKRNDFTTPNLEAYALERLRPSESLLDVVEPKDVERGHSRVFDATRPILLSRLMR